MPLRLGVTGRLGVLRSVVTLPMIAAAARLAGMAGLVVDGGVVLLVPRGHMAVAVMLRGMVVAVPGRGYMALVMMLAGMVVAVAMMVVAAPVVVVAAPMVVIAVALVVLTRGAMVVVIVSISAMAVV